MDLSKTSHHVLHTFDIRPNIAFETQRPGEEVILLVRAHPITLIPWIINAVILFILLVLGNIVFHSALTGVQIFYANLLITVFILSYVWFNILAFFFNVGLVTNMRIVDIDFSAVIYREVTDAQLSKVEDITSKSGGYFAGIFDFGDVYTQTAGTEENIEFLKAPHPAEIVRIINSVLPQ